MIKCMGVEGERKKRGEMGGGGLGVGGGFFFFVRACDVVSSGLQSVFRV